MQNIMEDKMSVLVMGCDKNEWLINVFFDFFKKNWADCPYDVYLSVEEKYINIPNVRTLREKDCKGWSERLIRSLLRIESKYVLLLLDDFMIETPVDQEKINRYLHIVTENDIYNLILTVVADKKNMVASDCLEWEKRDRYGRYKTSLQCGIWNKEVLLNLLKDKESAWQFELFGNIRSFLYKRNQFYCLKETLFKPVDYNDGFFMIQGRLNLNEKNRLEKKCGCNIVVPNNIYSFDDNMIRDDIRFFPRVMRRIKIIILYIIYRFLSRMGVNYENRIFNTK